MAKSGIRMVAGCTFKVHFFFPDGHRIVFLVVFANSQILPDSNVRPRLYRKLSIWKLDPALLGWCCNVFFAAVQKSSATIRSR